MNDTSAKTWLVRVSERTPVATRALLNRLRSYSCRATANLTSRKIRVFPLVLIAGGLCLLAYVASQYAEMYVQQRRLAEEWQQANSEPAPAAKSHSAALSNGVSRLLIPKINLDSFIVEGTNHRSLLIGPGHMKDSAIPGQSGNAVVTGHRDTFFRHIHELEKGDEIIVERGGEKFVYQVTGKRIVGPDDLSVVRPTPDDELTLITCYPTHFIGPAPKRLVVFSKLEQRTSGSEQSALIHPAQVKAVATSTASH